MNIAVLSGKGGAGKTLVSVNLAAVAGAATYIDCDVEEPNGHIFLKPTEVVESAVEVFLPAFDQGKCTGCRTCVDFCRFNALVYVLDKPMLFDEVCHSCGGCVLLCPEGAVSETAKQIGHIEEGARGPLRVVTGEMNLGEASGVPIVREALRVGLAASAEANVSGTESSADSADAAEQVTIVDCPPGSSCLAMESIGEADYCLLVVEPTAFGLHNFAMVHELAQLLGKPCGVVINKADGEGVYEPLERYLLEHDLTVHLRIPYRADFARRVASGCVLSDVDEGARGMFERLLADVTERVETLRAHACEGVDGEEVRA